jgi:diacylglycerol kinase family enzyme
MRDFGALLESLLYETTLFPGEDILFEVSFNPASGTLASPHRQNYLLKAMEEMSSRYEGEKEYGKSALPRSITVNMHPTQSREDSLTSVLEAVDRLKEYGRGGGPSENRRRAVLILAGGDGFHKDGITEIVKRDITDLEKFILFRLPVGTGNDTPFERDLIKALSLIFTETLPVKDSLISVSAEGRNSDYALNVVSFGLDAFVGLFTEKLKGRIKGDIYKIMVDVAALFYDFYHRTRISHVSICLEGSGSNKTIDIKKRVLLNVFGRGGHTCYGGGKKILPRSENLMITGFFHIPGRVMLKGMFMKGTHYPLKRVSFFHARSMTLKYPSPLLMQLDGEVTLLEKENFPVKVEKLSHKLSVLN